MNFFTTDAGEPHAVMLKRKSPYFIEQITTSGYISSSQQHKDFRFKFGLLHRATFGLLG